MLTALFGANRWIGLLVGDNEVTGSSYQRVRVRTTERTISGNVLTITITGDFTSTANNRTTEDWGTITKWGIYSAASAGNLLADDFLRNNNGNVVTVEVNQNDEISFPANAITVTVLV